MNDLEKMELGVSWNILEADYLLDLLTLARNARTSVEMIEKFYASTLSAEMNVAMLHNKRRDLKLN